MKPQRSLIVTGLAVSIVFASASHGAEALQKIRVGLPSVALTYMPFYVAQEKGFLKKAGIEAEYIQMNTAIQPQALINGNINFFPSLSTGISAAVAGLPLVAVLNFYTVNPWMLVTSKAINKPADLLGKKIAISGIRNTGHYLLMAWFKKVEINDKEISFVMTGGTAGSYSTLATNQVAGAVLTPPYDDKAVSIGFKKFVMIGDLIDTPTSGLVTSRAEIANNRERVQKNHCCLPRCHRLDPRQPRRLGQNNLGEVQNYACRSQWNLRHIYRHAQPGRPRGAENPARLHGGAAPGTERTRRYRRAKVCRLFDAPRREVAPQQLRTPDGSKGQRLS